MNDIATAVIVGFSVATAMLSGCLWLLYLELQLIRKEIEEHDKL